MEKLLQGENGLLFAYGVSNSGKTYTISGDGEDTAEGRGLLPRSIDVVFNSIKGLESKANVRRTAAWFDGTLIPGIAEMCWVGGCCGV